MVTATSGRTLLLLVLRTVLVPFLVISLLTLSPLTLVPFSLLLLLFLPIIVHSFQNQIKQLIVLLSQIVFLIIFLTSNILKALNHRQLILITIKVLQFLVQ